MAKSPHHFFVACVLLTYMRDGAPKQRHMNVFIETTTKKITMGHIDDARMAALQRLGQENEVTPDKVLDFCIINISHLGLMTTEEFSKIDEIPARKS